MIEISPSEYRKAAPLFQKIGHSAAIVHAVLEGNSTGKVFINDMQAPTLALLYADGAFCYLAAAEKGILPGDEIVSLIFNDLLPQMNEPELVLFAFSDEIRAQLDRLLNPKGVIRIQRKMFRFNTGQFQAASKGLQGIPEEFNLRLIDCELAAQFPRFLPLVESTTQRFGVCLLHGSEIASECSAIFVGRNEAEVDIHTADAYREKGLAALTARAFIEECLQRGLIPTWSCWPERKASRALALKLGFDELPDVPVHYWAKEM